MILDQTVPSYRLAFELEKESEKYWEQLDKNDRKVFDEMMSISRLYNVAGGCYCKSVQFASNSSVYYFWIFQATWNARKVGCGISTYFK